MNKESVYFIKGTSGCSKAAPLSRALCALKMRNLSEKEVNLLSELLNIAGIKTNISNLKVSEMKDGGMGSLSIGENYNVRKFGAQVAEYSFKDSDGVGVSVALNVDANNELYELDVFKSDFSQTKCLK